MTHANIDLDALYGKHSLPINEPTAQEDFDIFVRLGWLTLQDREPFMRAVQRHAVAEQ